MVKKESDKKISIIGAGRVGIALGSLLSQRGPSFSGIFSKSGLSTRKAIKLIKRGTIFSSIQELLQSSETILITVPDAEIKKVVKEILKKKNVRGKIFIHTSGLFSSSILNPLSSQGGSIASMHPLMSIPSPHTGVKLLQRAYFAIEGQHPARTEAQRLVQLMGAKSFFISSRMKSRYHLVACFLSNYIVALSDMVTDLLPEPFSKNEWLAIFSPLISATAQNLSQKGIPDALTGPISRADLPTLKRHMDIVRSLPRDLRDLHRILSHRALDIAFQQKKMNEKERERIIEVLRNRSSCINSH